MEDDERRLREEEMEQLLQQEHEEEEVPLEPIPETVQTPRSKRMSYTQVSFLAAFATIYYALRSRQQWYLAIVYLHSSKWAFCVLGNALIALAVQSFSIITGIFLNGLRVHEAEGLGDFFRWNVTETCIALTMFRSELTIQTTSNFLLLILSKCLHHVTFMREQHLRMADDAVVEGRGGWISIPWHSLKLVAFLIILQLLDAWTLQLRVLDILTKGPSVSILFAFEAAILLVSAWSHILLWAIHVMDGVIQISHDRASERSFFRWLIHPWKEHKATLTFAVELQSQAIQFIFYMAFFGIVMIYYGIPLNLFREVYVSFVHLRERLISFLKYRRLMASMNRFRDVDDETLEDSGRICIICRDEMTIHDCKQLPGCNHLFHKSCLREWLVQQQSCPTCRSDITANEAQEAQRAAAARAAQDREERAVNEETVEQTLENREMAAATLPTGITETNEEPTLQAEPAAPPQVEATHPERRVRAKVPKEERYAFPALYKTTRLTTVTDGTLLKRNIPENVVVLCHEYRMVGEKHMLRVPDGWIDADHADPVTRL